ncbi:MAG: TetR/AcrR family transcriptional regulator [Xanthobacteraceae bacterium]|nr:TetR/AcrR family transcriptional regulator [Xanthobacteraceae bacterium]
MRYSQDHKAETRARIVRKAAVRLRQSGPHGVAVADLMKQAGLTHGGFYAHFKSRDALIGEAMMVAMDGSTERWRKRADLVPEGKKVAAIIDGYLTEQHRDDVGTGCMLPALCNEVARSNAKTRKAFARRLEEMIALIVEARGTRPSKLARKQAMGAICAMTGALVLARATGGELSSDILKAGRDIASGQKSAAGAA